MESSFTERRRMTRSGIYHCLYDTDGISTRQSLAQSLGLSLPTIYQNLAELVDLGLVRYSGEAQSTGGRRAAGLEIVADARIAVGVSVSAHRLRFAAADLKLHELAYRSTEFNAFGRSLTDIGRAIGAELEHFLDEEKLDRSRLLGVCVAMPGLLTPERDRMLLRPLSSSRLRAGPALREHPLPQLYRKRRHQQRARGVVLPRGRGQHGLPLTGERHRRQRAHRRRALPRQQPAQLRVRPHSASSPAACPAAAASTAAWRPTARPTG